MKSQIRSLAVCGKALILANLCLAAGVNGQNPNASHRSNAPSDASIQQNEVWTASFSSRSTSARSTQKLLETSQVGARFSVRDMDLGEALSTLSRRSGVPILFSPSLIPASHKVSCECGLVSVQEALEVLLHHTDLTFSEHLGQVVIRPGVVTLSHGGVATPSIVEMAEALHRRDPSPKQALALPSSSSLAFPIQTGSIEGRVINRATEAPLSSVQVTLPELQIGTVTSASGVFSLTSVPSGTHVLRAELIGYRAEELEVTVRAGENTTVELGLNQQALALDEVVVTGTAGQARRREVGNTITQVDLTDRMDLSPSLDQLLQGQGAGISVIESGPSPGAGARIRLRGVTSVSQGNQPLIYIDGVRMHNNSPPSNTPIDGSGARSAHVSVSPLNDVNPEDIERIEVIKGASATTLYGAEAASGVIQIFTKRGVSGAPTYNVQMDFGFDRLAAFAPDPEPFMRLECCLRTGERRRVTASVGGGTDVARYFVSASLEDNTGILPVDRQEKVNLRGNFTMQLSDRLILEYNTGWTQNEMRHTPQGNNSQGLTTIAFRDQSSSLGPDWRETISEIYRWEITNDQTHLVTGLTARYMMTPEISTRFTLGLDRIGTENRNVRPFGFVVQPRGVINVGQWNHSTVTGDWVTNAGFGIRDDITTTLSFGGQLVATEETFINAYSDNLPGPGVPTVSSGSRQLSSEERQRVIRGGAFVQTLFGLADRYFLTAGLRVDGNSAFGENLGLQPYPKASFSWVIAEEDFWPEGLGQVRLRAAYGHAGRAPGAFDANRTWAPVGFAGEPAFYPDQVGNPDLGPERTKELEFGLDGSFFQDRLSAEVTIFRQNVSDLLYGVGQIPSRGFGGTQLANVGRVQNKGFEISLTGMILDRTWGQWEAGVNISSTRNKVLDLGGAPETTSIQVGQPLPVVQHTKLFNPNEIAEPDFVTDYLFGPRWPTENISINTAVRLPRGIVLSANGEYVAGFYVVQGGIFNTAGRLAWPECEVQAYDLLAAGRRDELTAYERLMCDPARPGGSIPRTYPGDFFKIRQLSLRAPIPTERLGSASVTVSARNVFRWTNRNWRWNDPEIMGRAGQGAGLETLGGDIAEDIPGPRMFTISVRTTF